MGEMLSQDKLRWITEKGHSAAVYIGYLGGIVLVIVNAMSFISEAFGLGATDPYLLFSELVGRTIQVTDVEKAMLFTFGLFSFAIVASIEYFRYSMHSVYDDIKRSIGVIDTLDYLGVHKVWIYGEESKERWKNLRSRAKTLDMLTVSGFMWIYGNEEQVVDLVARNDCRIRVILAHPKSDFVRLREMRESQTRTKKSGISKEIPRSIELWEEVVERVKQTKRTTRGSVEVRLIRGDYPCRLEIVDSLYVHWTPYIFPQRTRRSPAFEVHVKEGSELGRTLVNMFERLWEEASDDVVIQWSGSGEPTNHLVDRFLRGER